MLKSTDFKDQNASSKAIDLITHRPLKFCCLDHISRTREEVYSFFTTNRENAIDADNYIISIEEHELVEGANTNFRQVDNQDGGLRRRSRRSRVYADVKRKRTRKYKRLV